MKSRLGLRQTRLIPSGPGDRTTIKPSRIVLLLTLGLLAYRNNHRFSFLSDPSVGNVATRTADALSDPSSTFTPNRDNTTSSVAASSKGRFAYAYSIAGCNNENSCVGYVLNTLVASAILRHHNSTSDVYLLVRMSCQVSDETLPPDQEEWLRKAGVIVQYVPKVRTDNFGTATLEKFRILELVQYDRVRFFDADLIPLCNLDREFQDSYDGRLQGFVGKRGSVAPITASDFIVTPQRGLFERTMNLIRATRERTNGTWDPSSGWGHRFLAGERWSAGKRSGNQWDFYGASIDQGLLYQLFRYEVGSWSDTSGKGGKGHATWQETYKVPSDPDTYNSSWAPLSNGRWATTIATMKPWSRTVCFLWNGKAAVYNFHYNGSSKPWRNSVRDDKIPSTLPDPTSVPQGTFWFYWLGMANRTWELQLPSKIVPGGQKVNARNRQNTPLSYDKGKNKNILLDPDIEIPAPLQKQ